MRTEFIDVDGRWGIILNFNFTEKDEEEMSAIMDSFGMARRNIERSMRILFTHNSGMAVSRDDLRMSAIFIGEPTSRSQFWNSIAHELRHVSTAIIDYYGEPYNGEPAAYLDGYLLQKVVEEIAEPCGE